MNVGIVTTWFERGAAYVSRAYRDALRTRHNVFIYARGGERYAQGDPNWDRDYVTWGKRSPRQDRANHYVDWPDFRAWVARRKLDVVIFNEQTIWDVVVKARGLGLCIGAYIDYYTPETVPFFGLYDFLLCNTRRHHSVFEWHPRAFHVPWGTDLDVFRYDMREGNAGCVVFFHSGGMNPPRKGTDLLAEAFERVTGPAKLLIHTQKPLSALSPSCDPAGDPRIEVVEGEVHAPGLYHRGDVYVYPSRLDGIGLTIAEALACGLPVIATGAPPMSEFVIDGLNGRLVEVEREETRSDDYYWPMSICNVDSLARAMQFYVDNIGSLPGLRSAAREYAVTHLDWAKNSCNVAGLVEAVARCKRVRDRRLADAVIDFERRRGLCPPPLSRRVRSAARRVLKHAAG